MKLFCPEPLASNPLYFGFYFRFAPERKAGGLFSENLPKNFFETSVQYVETPEGADAIILPNNFTSLSNEARSYIARFADMGQKLGKPVFAFACGDYSADLVFDPRVRVFRYSLYRSRMTALDISAPTLVADIGTGGIALREKAKIPTVSFCGKAGFSSPREAVATWLKRLPIEVEGFFNPVSRARIRGVFWRQAAIAACERSKLVKTLFIIRKNFSGAMQTIELDPTRAREEFIRSVRDSDFVLAPKGDGNYSNRFLEALSMGRIPVLIDTDTVLPFEKEIDYSRICVKVPMNEVGKIPEYIRKFYDPLSQEEWVARQKLARETFEKYLKQDAFFEHMFA